ncbi:MAG: Tim44/TimA family putative adaptor protein [Shimia sp.]
MSSSIIQLLVLAGIAVFLILRLRSVLGTREGFEQENPRRRVAPGESPAENTKPQFEVIEGGPDRDIIDHVPEGSPQAEALAKMKAADNSFSVTEFIGGAKGAYEMILMAYENGDLSQVETFLDGDILEAFQSAIEQREEQGISIEATFIGIRDTGIDDATFDGETQEGEITMRFVGEMSQTVRDKGGDVIEAESSPLKRTRDVWTFARRMDAKNPNWTLVATGG